MATEKNAVTTANAGAQVIPLSQKIQGFDANLNKYESTVASLLGEKYGMSAKEFMVSVMNAVKKTPKLLDCDAKSLFGAILLSAELGLKPNTPEGFAYILPYGKEAQFQVGYKGLIEIAYRSPIVKSIKGVAVYENEYYLELEDGTMKHIAYTGMDLNIMQLCHAREQFIRQEIFMSDDELTKDITAYKSRLGTGKGKVILTYAVCQVEGLEKPIWVSVTGDVLKRIEGLSPSARSQSSPYTNGTDVHNSMQIKAAIKKLFKFLPKQGNAQMARAIEIDDKIMAGGVAIMTETGEVEILENEKSIPEVTVDPDELRALFDEKLDLLTADEQIHAERILKNKEENSYEKLLQLLQSK